VVAEEGGSTEHYVDSSVKKAMSHHCLLCFIFSNIGFDLRGKQTRESNSCCCLEINHQYIYLSRLVIFLFASVCTDDIKLFDFGMAKELKPEHKVDDENYRLSFCGSPSYMAPGTVQIFVPRRPSCFNG
jgi:serine/threonine protein kinase